MDAIGRSSGLTVLCDESKIIVSEVLKGVYSLTTKAFFQLYKVFWITNVYDPADYKERKYFWSDLRSVFSYCDGPQSREKFNLLIKELGRLEIPLSYGKCTWSRIGDGQSQSVLDRFFVPKEWDLLFEDSRTSKLQLGLL